MKEELDKAYDPELTDSKWSHFWEEGGFFEADPTSDKPPFCVVIPPPNVTGVLHMGHALVNTLQDIVIRYKRMAGFEALWVPGTDHAGIATQTVVERYLMEKEGKRRKEYDREEFLSHIWAWKEKSEKVILGQLKRLGASCDFSRLRFTMDQGCNKAVRTFFKKLYEKGLIYQGDYLVNWDPVTQTALADDEVEYEERQGSLWTIKYHLIDSSEYLLIATTRPETLLGDTALAVHPKDERYAHLIGSKARLPFLDRELPIIGDRHIDPEFGTGVVKITPAHDPNDYRMGLEHKLPMINILTPDAHLNENAGPFVGLTREEARLAVVEQLEKMGHLEKVERHVHRVGVSYRSKAVIEPYLSKQWFVKMAPFVEKLQSYVKEKKIEIIPSQWENTYFHWVNNLRDWCISRQLWWGHRIPIWHNVQDPGKTICFEGEGIPPEVEQDPEMWEQDPDVLDTWFSSALWPFSTLGWPEETEELQKFYPNGVLITGHDILFFWVARMLIMGDEAMGQLPFPETFLHGLIFGRSYWTEGKEGEIRYITGEKRAAYDKGAPLPKGVHSKWEKLSKSKGNAIDPLEIIDEYGTDAMRMTLCACGNQSPQIDLDHRMFEEFKNFANKVWNGARFVFMNLEGIDLHSGIDRSLLALEDRWILSLLGHVSEKMRSYLDSYQFEKAASCAYNFFWREFCAYYVEITKPVLFGKAGTLEEKSNKQKILAVVLCAVVRLLHPITPFITEELFHLLKERLSLETGCEDPYIKELAQALQSPACAVAPYPDVVCKEDIHPEIEQQFDLVEQIVHAIRNIRGEMKIPPHLASDVYLCAQDRALESHLPIIRALVKVGTLTLDTKLPQLVMSATAVIEGITITIALPQELAAAEKKRLEKEREKCSLTIDKLKAQLSNPHFLEKAHPDLVSKQKETLVLSEEKLATLTQKLENLL